MPEGERQPREGRPLRPQVVREPDREHDRRRARRAMARRRRRAPAPRPRCRPRPRGRRGPSPAPRGSACRACGRRPAGASTRSLTVPMANWSRVIDRPRTTPPAPRRPRPSPRARRRRRRGSTGTGGQAGQRPARSRTPRRAGAPGAIRRRRARRSSTRGTRSAGRARRRPATGSPGRAPTARRQARSRRPSASFPTVAGGPPPEANTRSNSGSLSFADRRKSATTFTIPRRLATSRISSDAQVSIWASGWSASRARYSVGSAERPVGSHGVSWRCGGRSAGCHTCLSPRAGRRPPRAAIPRRRRRRATRGRSPPRRPGPAPAGGPPASR